MLSLAYGFISKEQRENNVAARAYKAILVGHGYDDVVKGAVRLVPYTQHTDDTVTFFPTKVTRSYKVFDRIYPLKGGAVTYPQLPSECTWIEGDEWTDTMTDGDLIVGPSKPVPVAYTVERIINHSRFGDALGDIEYQCRYEGHDSTHDHYHQLCDLKKCKSLIDDYWKQQKDDSERRARIVSLAFSSDVAAVENAISTHQAACDSCDDVHPPLCPDELCVGCCEMGGYACLSVAAAGTEAGCTPLWGMDRSALTADQKADLATLEEDFYDAPDADDDKGAVGSTRDAADSTNVPVDSANMPVDNTNVPASKSGSKRHRSMPARDADIALNWDRPFTASTFSSLYAIDASFPPVDNSRASDAAAGENSDGMPSMFDDDTSPCTTDSDRE